MTPEAHVWQHLDVDWLARLDEQRIMYASSIQSLSTAIDCGGFVSGGFACFLARALLHDHVMTRETEAWKRLFAYVDSKPNFDEFRAITGDVDVFFPTQTAAYAATSRVLEKNVYPNTPTRGGYGREIRASNNVFQFIHKIHGEPEHVLGGFDIANAKVYLDRRGLHFTNRWNDLERKRFLAVDSWDKSNLLWRLNKWFRKHSYVDFSADDHEKFVDYVFRLLTETQHGQIIRWGNKIGPADIKRIAKRYWHYLPMRDLLLLSAAYDGYDQLQAVKMIADASARV